MSNAIKHVIVMCAFASVNYPNGFTVEFSVGSSYICILVWEFELPTFIQITQDQYDVLCPKISFTTIQTHSVNSISYV